MERIVPTRGGHGTDGAEACMLVEEVVANDKGRTTAALFVTRVWVESYGDKVPFPWDVLNHLPHLSADGVAPIEFLRLMVFWYALDKLAKVKPAPNAADRGDNETPIPHGNVHFVPDGDVRVREQFLAQAKPLAIAPFLNPRDQ